MHYIIFVCFLILIFLIIMLLFCKNHNKENYISNINLDKIIPFPEKIDYDNHDYQTKSLLDSIPRDPISLELENKLIEEGKLKLESIKNNYNYSPDLRKYDSNSQLSKLLLQTWSRYFKIADDLENYIHKNKLPDIPSLEKNYPKDCICKEVEYKNKEYGESLLKLVNKIKYEKKRSKQNLPNFTHKGNKKKCCYDLYTKWTLYNFSLTSIINYLNNVII